MYAEQIAFKQSVTEQSRMRNSGARCAAPPALHATSACHAAARPRMQLTVREHKHATNTHATNTHQHAYAFDRAGGPAPYAASTEGVTAYPTDFALLPRERSRELTGKVGAPGAAWDAGVYAGQRTANALLAEERRAKNAGGECGGL